MKSIDFVDTVKLLNFKIGCPALEGRKPCAANEPIQEFFSRQNA